MFTGSVLHPPKSLQVDLRLASVRALVVLSLSLGACAAVEPPPIVPPVSRGLVQIRSFTEVTAARGIHPLGAFVFVHKGDGLERWDRQGHVLEIAATHGLAGTPPVAVAADPQRQLLWMLSPGELGRYHVGDETYRPLPVEPPLAEALAELAPDAVAMLAPAVGGGVWLAGPFGLYYASDENTLSVPFAEPVTALADTAEGLLIGSPRGLWLRRSSGDVLELGAEHGLLLPRVGHLAAMPALGAVLAIGRDEQGQTRLALGQGGRWHTYRLLPNLELSALTSDDGGALLLGSSQILRLAPRALRGTRPLLRDGVRVAPLTPGAPELELTALPWLLPAAPVSLAATDEHVLLGTRDLGVARFAANELRPGSWLRRRHMFADASTLSVACTAASSCWLATGARSAWRWNGERFEADGPDEVVLAVVRDRGGSIWALHREARDATIRLSRLEGSGQWTPFPKAALVTAEKDPEVSFVRPSSSGALWVGLRYRDGRQLRDGGVAVIEPSAGRSQLLSPAAGPRVRGVSAEPTVPAGVVDGDVRGEVAWLATAGGVARLAGRSPLRWSDVGGLGAARAIAVTRDAVVYAATAGGVGRLLGERWLFPAMLAFQANDLAVTSDGLLWMATPRGLAVYDGTKVRRVDLRRGLVENQILDIAIDRYDRVWARGPGSLTLISPSPR